MSRSVSSLILLPPQVLAVARFYPDSSIFKGGFPAQDNFLNPALDFPALEGSPAAAGVLIGGLDFIGRILVHLNPGLRLLGQMEDPAGIDNRFLKNIVQGQPSLVDRCEQ